MTTVYRLIYFACQAALAAVSCGTFAQTDGDLPKGFESAAMYHCGSGPLVSNTNSLIVWTDKVGNVVAIGGFQEYSKVPDFATQMVIHNDDFNSLFNNIKGVSKGYAVHHDRLKHLVLQVGPIRLRCVATHED
jgi:hypothetical protein